MLENSYMARFWTGFEAWLSFQKCTPYGIQPASEAERRFEIVPIHAAAVAGTETANTLIAAWAGRTPQEAHDYLSKPDVRVTNQKDKEGQLQKLRKLDEEVKAAFAARRGGAWDDSDS